MTSMAVGWRARGWEARLGRYRDSGMTISEFCLRERVSTASFYQWRKRLCKNSTPRRGNPPSSPVFSPVRLVTSPSGGLPLVTVELPGGTRLEIPMSDSEAFERAIQVLVSSDADRTMAPRPGEASC